MSLQLDLAEVIRNHCGDLFKNPTTGPDRVARVVLDSSLVKMGKTFPAPAFAPDAEIIGNVEGNEKIAAADRAAAESSGT